MKHLTRLLLLILIMLAGCSSAPPVPDWSFKSYNHLEEFKKAALEGHLVNADRHFSKALEEIKKSGDLDLLAKAYLIRMAMDVAMLENPGDDEFLKIDAVQPDPVNRNFYAFLRGNFSAVQEQQLPEQYRGALKRLLQGKPDDLAAELTAVQDPASRLITAGIAIRHGLINETILMAASEAASRNGWKRALLVYLEQLKRYYTKQDQPDKAKTISQKIQLLLP